MTNFLSSFYKLTLLVLLAKTLGAQAQSSISTDGFFQLSDHHSRRVFNFNNGWLYHRGSLSNGQSMQLEDTDWQQVQLPHGTDLLPEDASGGPNYQGVIWYRKHFVLPEGVQHQILTLTFEAIMGKCDIYLNGQKIQSHKGGYLPIVIDLSKVSNLNRTSENIIAVMADNSDDPNYPPGKEQIGLDFSYYGGIYRDCWLVATDQVHITNPNLVNEVAGGGVFVSYSEVSEALAKVHVQAHIQNESVKNENLFLEFLLKNKEGKVVAKAQQKLTLKAGASSTLSQEFRVLRPELWHPDRPYLYQLHTLVKDRKNRIRDGFYQKIGIRMVELRGKEGLYLNGQFFNDKLIGANHHQDFAVIGNAVPNNLSWNDAKKLRDAGIRILRLSHYPQDPSFMDACDELGIFTIVAIPGWQFWNKDNPDFEKLMLSDVRQTIRRDRNHPSVFAWEPVPNETHYPASFAEATYQATHQEYPYQGCIAVCDYGHPKWQLFDLVYGHPHDRVTDQTDKCVFTREWGDNVDNWVSHNSPSRAAIQWGEIPQLVQAKHYAHPDYLYTSWENLYNAPKQHIGGALWHAFDNGRGYHPDVFYGGILSPFRQPKYSYELFRSQQNPYSEYVKANDKNPYHIFIAHLMSPFSPSDVTVFTNCDSVALHVYGKKTYTLIPDKSLKMPHPPLVFKDVFHFMDIKEISIPSDGGSVEVNNKAEIVAVGYVAGKEVARTSREPAKRPSTLKLYTDLEGVTPQADGSTIIPVYAQIEDDRGNVKRLNELDVHFEVEGEGNLVGKGIDVFQNRKIVWGAAYILVRTTLRAGKIKVHVMPEYQGGQTATPAVIEIQTIQPDIPAIFQKESVTRMKASVKNAYTHSENTPRVSEEERKKILKKVEKDQSDFMKAPSDIH